MIDFRYTIPHTRLDVRPPTYIEEPSSSRAAKECLFVSSLMTEDAWKVLEMIEKANEECSRNMGFNFTSPEPRGDSYNERLKPNVAETREEPADEKLKSKVVDEAPKPKLWSIENIIGESSDSRSSEESEKAATSSAFSASGPSTSGSSSRPQQSAEASRVMPPDYSSQPSHSANQQHLVSQQQHLVPQQQHLLPQQQHLVMQQQHLMSQQHHLMTQRQHLMQQQQQLMQQQQQLMPQQQQLMPQQQQSMQQQQQLMPQQQQLMPQQQHLMHQQQHLIPQQQYLLQQSQQQHMVLQPQPQRLIYLNQNVTSRVGRPSAVDMNPLNNVQLQEKIVDGYRCKYIEKMLYHDNVYQCVFCPHHYTDLTRLSRHQIVTHGYRT